MILNKLSKFKTNIIWKFLIKYFVKPLYELIWVYIINFEGRILYKSWFKEQKPYIDLNNNDKKLIINNRHINYLAKKIFKECTAEIIEIAKKNIYNNKDNGKNVSNFAENQYKISLLENLSEKTKKEILDFAQSDLLISTAAKYLKVFPILGKVALYLNIPRENNDKQRGAMLWHRDDFGYKSLDLFVIINDVDDYNGPLYTIEEKSELGVFERFQNEIKNPTRGERGKVAEEEFKSYLSKKNLLKLQGQKGNGLLIDSFTAYHKGGRCLKNHRIMLRYSYQTVDATRLPEIVDNQYFYSKEIKKQNIKNKFYKYLFFKRSKLINNLKMDKFLLNLYRILQFKF